MNTAILNTTELSRDEMQQIDGGLDPATMTVGATLAFGAGVVLGSAVVIGGAYLIYKAVTGSRRRSPAERPTRRWRPPDARRVRAVPLLPSRTGRRP